MEENVKKKSFLKGFLLTILAIVIIIAVGLLIRMLVADDGDYFKPFKQIFGMEEEADDEEDADVDEDADDDDKDDEDSKKESKKKSGKTSLKSAKRYTLLSDDVKDKGVKHYRLSVDLKDTVKKAIKEANKMKDDSSYSDIEDSIDDYLDMVEEYKDQIAGEMYFDIYFTKNELNQIVIGYDYAELIENLYEYLKDEDEESLEDEDIKSADDMAKYITKQFKQYADKDTIYSMIKSEAGYSFESSLKQLGIKESDIKDMFDIKVEDGLIELYINGTEKLKSVMNLALDSEGFEEALESVEDETDVKIDSKNIYESAIKSANSSDEMKKFGFKFEEVK